MKTKNLLWKAYKQLNDEKKQEFKKKLTEDYKITVRRFVENDSFRNLNKIEPLYLVPYCKLLGIEPETVVKEAPELNFFLKAQSSVEKISPAPNKKASKKKAKKTL